MKQFMIGCFTISIMKRTLIVRHLTLTALDRDRPSRRRGLRMNLSRRTRHLAPTIALDAVAAPLSAGIF